MQKRTKWLEPNYSLQAGDLVIIKDDLYPPARWLLGRVTDVHPGSDGLVRVATVKTANSQYKRPLAKLVRLPINADAAEAAILHVNRADSSG